MRQMNEEQLEAVMSNERKILCLAGAGTGKTTCMLERIDRLVHKKVNPLSILVLTFTNAAAFEMQDRYCRDHSSKLVPTFRTFHSFCYYVLATNIEVRRLLGYSNIPQIADEFDLKEIYRQAQTKTGIRYSFDSLMKKPAKSKNEEFEYVTLKKMIDKELIGRNLITFDKLCTEICNLFVSDHDAIQQYKQQYEYIFVDEFQDTDATQYDFITSFTSARLFVVGDALQAIYGFRGADSSIIKSLAVDPSWYTIKLYRNYRSSSRICTFANLNSTYADDSFRVAIESSSNDDTDFPVVEWFFTDRSYLSSVSSIVLDSCFEYIHNHPGSAAVLCRTNKEVDAVQKYCDAANIHYETNKNDTDMLNVLISAGDNDYLMRWLSSYLDTDKYAKYIRVRTLAIDNNVVYDLSSFLNDFKQIPAIDNRWMLVKFIRNICMQQDLSEIQRGQRILNVFGYPNIMLDETHCTTMRNTLDYLIELYQQGIETTSSTLHIGTIHSVKGLEFDNVCILGVDGASFKLDNEENKNLYYVAITRAKKHLMVFRKGK